MRRLTALALVALIISSVFAREARPVAASSGGPLVPALLPADSTIAASPNPVLAGNRVTVSGSGWPGSAQILVCMNLVNTTCTPVTTDAFGAFAIQLTVPANTPPGMYIVAAQIGMSTPLTTQLQVAGNSQIALSPVPVRPGQTELVSGRGFAAGELILVQFPALFITGGGATQQATGTADATGSFAIGLPIPVNAVAGNYIVTARGLSSGLQSTALMNVAAQPTLTISPTVASPGATITISGQRWSSNWPLTAGMQVPLVNGGTENLSASPSADPFGNFSVQLIVPLDAAPGPVTVTVTQTQGGQTYTLSQTITVARVQPRIQLVPTSVVPGGSVQVLLTGFSPDSGAPITVSTQVVVSGVVELVTLNAVPDGNGNATAILPIPAGAAPGQVTATATQPASGASVSTQLQILAVPTTSTPTPTPTATPPPTTTPTPTPTSSRIPPPPPPPPTPIPTERPLRFRHLSLWYSVVIVGTFNHINLRANQRGVISVDAVVTYPNGVRLHYNELTNPAGRWSKTFPVPAGAIRGRLRTALVQVSLQRGQQTSLERSLTFTLIRQ